MIETLLKTCKLFQCYCRFYSNVFLSMPQSLELCNFVNIIELLLFSFFIVMFSLPTISEGILIGTQNMNKPKHIFKLISRITLYHLNHSYRGLELVIEPRCGNWNTNLLMEVIGYNYSEEGWTDILDLSWRTFSGCSLDVMFIISVGVYEKQQNQESLAWGQGIEKLGQSEWMGWKCRGALGNKNKAQKPEGNLCLLKVTPFPPDV